MYDSVEFVLRSPFQWEVTDTNQSRSGLPPRQLPAFTLPTGPVPRTTHEKTPLKIFSLFVTDSILN